MNQEPLVSVLMTAYNREKYIGEAIESVIASSYTRFELIIVDDCSKDNTVQIIERYATKDKRIRFHVNEKNIGDYHNRNKAAGFARGKYLKYLDSDDMIYQHGLMDMVAAIEKFPGAAMAMMWIYDDSIKQPLLCSPEEGLHEYFIENRWLMVGPTGCIYSKDIFFRLGGFSGRTYISDFEFNMKCALRYPVVKMPNGLVFYRVHDHQQGWESGHTKTFRKLLYKFQSEVLNHELCPLREEDRRAAFRKINKLQARRALFYFLRTLNIKESYSLIKDSGLGWKNFVRGLLSFK